MKIPFLERFRRRDITGMDIGSSGVKFVRVRQAADKGEPSLEEWYYPGAVFEDPEKEIPAFRDFLAENRLTGSHVACNIEDAAMKIRRVELPKMPESDLKEAVKWQLRDVVQGPVTDYIVRHSLIDETTVGDVKKLSLVAYAIPKAAVQKLLGFLRLAALKPVVVEPTAVSLLAAFDRLHGWKKGEYHGLVDFGESKTLFTVMSEGRLFFSRPMTGVTGLELIRMLKKELSLGPVEIDRLKKQWRDGDTGQVPLQDRMEMILSSHFSKASMETQRSIDSFALMFRTDRIDHLCLCGSGSLLPGLKDSLAKNLAIPTHVLGSGLPARISFVPGKPQLYGVALGLALFSGGSA